MEQRRERVHVETERHRISGWLTMPAGGYRSRVTDVLNAERHFLTLIDCEVELLEQPGTTTHHPVLAVSRRHVVLVIPQDEGAEG
ncbi:unannotated protein [freshwater metagenome]|uniref:Unannotated protein n=1 Tax=freshwater metagenome TaxID=449393 RepID=A0A6J7CY88_9ZZZZ|nr:hypothetical protein [Actinomycetota bacterium]